MGIVSKPHLFSAELTMKSPEVIQYTSLLESHGALGTGNSGEGIVPVNTYKSMDNLNMWWIILAMHLFIVGVIQSGVLVKCKTEKQLIVMQ